MTALIIVAIIFLIIIAILFLPVTVNIRFYEDLFLKVKFFGIKVYEITPDDKKEKNETEKTAESEKEKPQKKENSFLNTAKGTFSRLKKEKGFVGAVKEIMGFAGRVLSHIKKLLRHINICKVKLDIVVASSDAAKTAIDYGIVCQAVYPVAAMLNTCAKIGFKEINVKSDFESEKCDFGFAATVKMQIFYLIIAAFKIFSEYKNFVTEKNENERKQS